MSRPTSHNLSRKRGPYSKWKVCSEAVEYDAEVLFAPPMESFEISSNEFQQSTATIDLSDIGSHENYANPISNQQCKILESGSSPDISDQNYDQDFQNTTSAGENLFLENGNTVNINTALTYTPPVNDEQDNLIDILFNELHDTVLLEKEDELNDEAEQVEDLFDHVSQFVIDTAEYQSESRAEDTVDPPIYDGSRCMLGVTVLLLCCFMIRFRLSDEAMSYMISFLGLLLPDSNKLPKSLYGIRQFFKKHVPLPEIKYYCSWCYSHVKKDVKVCPNQYCMKDLTISGSLSYFVLHSLISQIQTMFKRKAFTEAVRSHRFDHYKKMKGKNLISDVYDGENYTTLYNNGFLSDENNLSFSMNTDGVPLFKSSKLSMWPVYLMINELPMNQRIAKENLLFYGVWISTKKPLMWCFLKPLYTELRQLESGIMVEDYKGNVIKSCATLLSVTCDLPAKCLVANCVQFNGTNSCWYCLQTGKTHKIKEHGHCHVFPYQHSDPMGPPRTASSVECDVNESVRRIETGQKSYVSRGIKGPSWFLFLKHFNVIDGYVIDYMHGLCAGVMKTLLRYWFSKDHKNEPYSCFALRNVVNTALSKIKPTRNINRVPRSLDDIVHWKSSEYRNFLLYWGVPILRNVLKEAYFLHFCLLVQAIFLLFIEGISPDDIIMAERSLLLFVENCEQLYTTRILTMNFHQLVHLTKNVVANGPLFVNSCFIFEDFNGFLVQHIHGSQGVDTQIINTINLIQTLPVMREKYLLHGTDEWCFYSKLMNKIPSNRVLLTNDMFAIGKASFKDLTAIEYEEISDSFHLLSCHVTCFNRMYFKQGDFYVYGLDYKRQGKRNQSLVKYNVKTEIKFGIVKYFAQFTDGNDAIRNVALLYSCDHKATLCSGAFHIVEAQEKLSAVSIDNIVSSCLIITVDNTSYICEFPNRYDVD